jgi:glycerophosphoryl diester phosphodiesterase
MKHLLSIITGLLILPLLVSCGGGESTKSDNTGAAYIPTELQILQGVVTVWTFTDPQDPLAASQGSAKLSYRDPANTGWGPLLTRFEKTSILGLPPVNGIDKTVMAFPATDKDQGYTITHNSLSNGVFADEGYVSNYTIIMDILWTEENSGKYRSFYQASADNSDDAEFFAENKVGGGIGVRGNYTGELSPDQWHRVAIAVQCVLGAGGTGQLHKYIDGRFVGGQYTPADLGNEQRCPWALEPVFHLFTDNDGETAEGYVSSVMYVDRLMSMDEITALGRPVAEGANFRGTDPLPVANTADRRVQIIAHRTNSGYSPENTVVGISQAFDKGADAVEVDVRITKDGELVLMHDEDISRTTNGSGLVSDISLTELKKLDAGSWFSPFYSGEQVPTLTEALEAAKGRGKLLLDVKSLLIGSSIKSSLNEAGVGDDAVWPSQNVSDTAAEDFKKYMPDAGILWMGIPDPLTKEEFDKLKDKGVTGFDIDYSLATKEFIDAAHLNGMFVFVYTVMDQDTMLYLIDIGVDGMETDFPGILNSIMPKE